MRKALVVAIVTILVLSVATVAAATEYTDNEVKSGHKIVAKLDATGSFANYPGYNWDSVDDLVWDYEVHIKEAQDPNVSRGVVYFSSDGIEITGHVTRTDRNHPYWVVDNLAAYGWLEYGGEVYDFMMLYSADKIWLAAGEPGTDLLTKANRVHQLHSVVGDDLYYFTFKEMR